MIEAPFAPFIEFGFMRRALASLAEAPESRLRLGGLIAAAGGIGLAWLLKLF